jgi:23S rRNA pseudouridine2605 synthase
MAKVRLNAFLADCGVASRRKSAVIVLDGHVRVNGKIVLAPYLQVDSEKDVVEYDGTRLMPLTKVYVAINKPVGVVCAVTDKYDPVVVDLLPKPLKEARVFPVGRLDRESEGLLVLTNDGEFAQELQHPSRGVTKEYEVLLNLEVNDKHLRRWRGGFEIEGRRVKPLLVEIMNKEPASRWVRIAIGEGLKREVRTMANLAGFGVLALIRRKIGGLTLSGLKVGEFVELSFIDMCTRIFKGGSV